MGWDPTKKIRPKNYEYDSLRPSIPSCSMSHPTLATAGFPSSCHHVLPPPSRTRMFLIVSGSRFMPEGALLYVVCFRVCSGIIYGGIVDLTNSYDTHCGSLRLKGRQILNSYEEKGEARRQQNIRTYGTRATHRMRTGCAYQAPYHLV